MKAAFIFMSSVTGFGGHHVSTRELVTSMRNKGHECWVISIGAAPSIVFKDDKNFLHFNIKPYSLTERGRLRKLLNKESFDVFFPIDETSCRILFSIYPSALNHTVPIKPGWINVDSWTNLTNDFICFSKENYDYMLSLRKYSSVKVHLIPNRVSVAKQDFSRIKRFKEEFNINEHDRILLGISRIDPDKISVFKALKSLAEKMSGNGFPIKAFIIGSISSEDTMQAIEKELGATISIITDSLYTTNVSQLFSMACAVVGMGRTAMESMSLGIPTFIPNMDSQLPVLIDNNTFEASLAANFTYRTRITNSLLNDNVKNIEYFHISYNNICVDTLNLFQDNLDVETGITKYIEIGGRQKFNTRNFSKEIRACMFSNIRWTASVIYSKLK